MNGELSAIFANEYHRVALEQVVRSDGFRVEFRFSFALMNHFRSLTEKLVVLQFLFDGI